MRPRRLEAFPETPVCALTNNCYLWLTISVLRDFSAMDGKLSPRPQPTEASSSPLAAPVARIKPVLAKPGASPLKFSLSLDQIEVPKFEFDPQQSILEESSTDPVVEQVALILLYLQRHNLTSSDSHDSTLGRRSE